MKHTIALVALLGSAIAAPQLQTPAVDPLDGLVQSYLWPASDADRRAVEASLKADGSLVSLSRERFHDPEQARAVIAALRARYRINPDRIVSTGISLGSNYSIAFAASHADWLSAIVPVSTEGDSRELLLRNLRNVPVYVLEGSLDRNIRAI